MKNGHWSVEEYREYLRTGKEPTEENAGEKQAAELERQRRRMLESLQERLRAEPKTAGGSLADVLGAEPKKRPKYGNRKTDVNGIPFDSQHEAEVYLQLMDRVKAGELKCVMRQVRFDLGGGPYAAKESRYQYIADFVTVDPDNRLAVLDAKSEATRKDRTYINKKKQMMAEWGIEVQEV